MLSLFLTDLESILRVVWTPLYERKNAAYTNKEVEYKMTYDVFSATPFFRRTCVADIKQD
jgi:hypothetical protein